VDLAAALGRAAAAAAGIGLPIEIPDQCGVPICLLPERPEVFQAVRYPVLAPAGEAGDPNHLKAAACRACRHDLWCGGIWRLWAERFGLQWLRPVP
jgi:hypothetical protein